MIRTAGVDIDVHRTTFAWRHREQDEMEAEGYPSVVEWKIFQCVTPKGELATLKAIKMAGVKLVAIERPYLGKNVQTYGRLSEVFGRIAGLCDLAGIPWKGTLAEVWQRGMISQGNYLPDGKGRKGLGMMVALNLGAEPKNDDCSDAVCLAAFEEQGDRR